ncbi:hypothetical protein BD408DRAFT_323952, partial [Parasitella parasitica]
DGILLGGRLSQFVDSWKKITSQFWSISVIRDGYRLQFVSKPYPWKFKKMHHSLSEQL